MSAEDFLDDLHEQWRAARFPVETDAEALLAEFDAATKREVGEA
jgi:hypothetical protein